MTKLEVGQVLWFVHSDHRRRGGPRAAKVVKIGRLWATLDIHYRVDIRSLWADGGRYSSPGRCYVNLEAYEQEQRLTEAWRQFHQDVSRQCRVPAHVTLEDIQAATALIFEGKNAKP